MPIGIFRNTGDLSGRAHPEIQVLSSNTVNIYFLEGLGFKFITASGVSFVKDTNFKSSTITIVSFVKDTNFKSSTITIVSFLKTI